MDADLIFGWAALLSALGWLAYRLGRDVWKDRRRRRIDRRWAEYQTHIGLEAEQLARATGLSQNETYQVLTKLYPFDYTTR